MEYRKTDVIHKIHHNGRKWAAVKKGAALFLAGMMLSAFFAPLPLQAGEAAESGGGPCTNESLSDNNVPQNPPKQEDQEQQENQTPPQDDSRQGTAKEERAPSDGQASQKPPRITSEPEDVSVEVGDCAYFNVSAVGENLTYQWYVDKGNGTNFQKIKGADSSLYRVMVFDGSMNGYAYKCRVTAGKGDGEEGNQGNNNKKAQQKEDYTESRAARLTVCYRIVSGARSVWVKSSGRGLVFQGSGAYSGFVGVSVDGSRITAGEYNKGGSQTPFTEITLLRSYLETLAEGEHEIEMIWSDGAAKTSFRIEPPASGLAGASGLGRTGADTEGSSRAAGKTAAAVTGMAAGRDQDQATSVDREEKTDAEGVSENALQESLSGNSVKPSPKTAADVLSSAGIFAGRPGEEMAVKPGERRTKGRLSGFEKDPVQLAAVSEHLDRYAKTICMAVILISSAGIASGLIAYKLHDVEGYKR